MGTLSHPWADLERQDLQWAITLEQETPLSHPWVEAWATRPMPLEQETTLSPWVDPMPLVEGTTLSRPWADLERQDLQWAITLEQETLLSHLWAEAWATRPMPLEQETTHSPWVDPMPLVEGTTLSHPWADLE